MVRWTVNQYSEAGILSRHGLLVAVNPSKSRVCKYVDVLALTWYAVVYAWSYSTYNVHAWYRKCRQLHVCVRLTISAIHPGKCNIIHFGKIKFQINSPIKRMIKFYKNVLITSNCDDGYCNRFTNYRKLRDYYLLLLLFIVHSHIFSNKYTYNYIQRMLRIIFRIHSISIFSVWFKVIVLIIVSVVNIKRLWFSALENISNIKDNKIKSQLYIMRKSEFNVRRNLAKTGIQQLLNVEEVSPEHLRLFARLDSFNYGN